MRNVRKCFQLVYVGLLVFFCIHFFMKIYEHVVSRIFVSFFPLKIASSYGRMFGLWQMAEKRDAYRWHC